MKTIGSVKPGKELPVHTSEPSSEIMAAYLFQVIPFK
jgi:hypothetical protein